MEHSYSRDTRPSDKAMATRTILVHKPPPCPSCHHSSHESDTNIDDRSFHLPPLHNDTASREAMEVIGNIAAKTKNRNLEEDDWEELVDKLGWTVYQHTLFAKVAETLNLDRLARLTYLNHPNEPALRRMSIDKAVQRMRKAFSVIHWDLKLTQWLHGLLIDHLPVSYVTAYMDILQTLRSKVPSLVDKMVQGRSNELLEAVLKPPWEPTVEPKDRRITPEPVIVVVPSGLTNKDSQTKRQNNWMTLLATITPHVQRISIPENFCSGFNLNLPDYLEQLVTLCRSKLIEVRKEHPMRPIVLLGFNAGSALALQVASLEQTINSVICMGFATNTLKGNRGSLDDRLVDLHTPVLFVIGQNAARTSQEQIEALREQMIAATALVVVGSADDSLTVSHAKRRLENVTQSMVDNMVMDEVSEFTSSCLNNPPSPMKKRPVIAPVNAAPTTIVILDSPDKSKMVNGMAAGIVRKARTPVKVGRVSKKKLLERTGLTTKMSPPKKEYAEKLTMSSQGGTSYEIVTGKIKQDSNMRQVVEGGFIQIASEGANPKWQIAKRPPTTTTINRDSVIMPVLQKQKISLGNQFTPMRTNGEHLVLNSKTGVTSTALPKNTYSVSASGKVFALQPTEVTETIELDSEEEIINLEGETIIDAQVVDQGSLVTETVEMDLSGQDLSNIPVVFQDSDGNIQDPLGNGEMETILISDNSQTTMPPGSVIVSRQSSVIPRPNKFIYYKPQQIVSKATPTQYVVLSGVEEKGIVATAATTTANSQSTVKSSSKPLIISVESLEKGAPNTVYHVVEDSEKEE